MDEKVDIISDANAACFFIPAQVLDQTPLLMFMPIKLLDVLTCDARGEFPLMADLGKFAFADFVTPHRANTMLCKQCYAIPDAML